MRVLSSEERAAGDVLRAVRGSRNVLGIVPANAVDARVRALTVGGRDPLRDPERYPLRIRSERPVAEVTTHRRRRHHAGAAGSAAVTRLIRARRSSRSARDWPPPRSPSVTSNQHCQRQDHRLRAATHSQRVRGSPRGCEPRGHLGAASRGVRSCVPRQQSCRRLRRSGAAADSCPLRLFRN